MSYFLLHEPSRGIGGETASRQAARRVNLPSGGRFSNITEDVRKYAAEQAISEEEALQRGMAEKSKRERRFTRRRDLRYDHKIRPSFDTF